VLVCAFVGGYVSVGLCLVGLGAGFCPCTRPQNLSTRHARGRARRMRKSRERDPQGVALRSTGGRHIAWVSAWACAWWFRRQILALNYTAELEHAAERVESRELILLFAEKQKVNDDFAVHRRERERESLHMCDRT